MDRTLHDGSRMFRAVISTTVSLNSRYQAYRSLLTAKDKFAYRFLMEISEQVANGIRLLADDPGVKKIEAVDGMEPLVRLIGIADEVLNEYED